MKRLSTGGKEKVEGIGIEAWSSVPFWRFYFGTI